MIPALRMVPGCGDRLLRFVGDRVRYVLQNASTQDIPHGWQAMLRTNLGRAAQLQEEIIQAHFKKLPLAGASWRDIPMRRSGNEWFLELPLTEVGYFQAKAYAIDSRGRQHWPDGANIGISVHPNDARTNNIIYCAFTRLHGETCTLTTTRDESLEHRILPLDEQGFSVIPPSGKLRHLTRQIPHICNTLGCRILHLLPINPTPTTFARFGRYGSPYACQDLTAIDPALVEFDRRTTGLDQFGELVRAVHGHGGKLFLDLVINHTGWGATLWEEHPEWYKRLPDGEFESPGAWGNIWRDLVELDQRFPALWAELAEAFLVWCRRGVDGFRCDAGYKVPLPVWQHITARVRQEYPETVFLLEGLGGSWDATENLLTEGGMQWAYSELFQNYSGREVSSYLDYGLHQSERVGTYVHYSETHDNNRLAARGRNWSLLRNRLCALTSANGGFGYTGGVEWLAAEKVNVHQCSGLSWGNPDNLINELSALGRLLSNHPCFFDGARCNRLSDPESPVYALNRVSWSNQDEVLVLINLDTIHWHSIHLVLPLFFAGKNLLDLLGQAAPVQQTIQDREVRFELPPGSSFCLSPSATPNGIAGDEYRENRARAGLAIECIRHYVPIENIGPADWLELSKLFDENTLDFLAAIPFLNHQSSSENLTDALKASLAATHYPAVVCWSKEDARRITLVPPGHWLVVSDKTPFRAQLTAQEGMPNQNVKSVRFTRRYFAVFSPHQNSRSARLILERDGDRTGDLKADIRFLPNNPPLGICDLDKIKTPNSPLNEPMVLLTNGIGGMARVCVNLGHVKSKYDCLLAANLHQEFPVDRHVLVKRIRIWANADGFITPLNADNLVEFHPGPPAHWRFIANAGDGRSVELELVLDMVPEKNTILLKLARPDRIPKFGKPLPHKCIVSLTARLDIEDRNFHWETKHNEGSDHFFTTHCREALNGIGFEFTPSRDRQLRALCNIGFYHHQPEWSHNLPHFVEQTRGQESAGDSYSPGWFEIPLKKGEESLLAATIETDFTFSSSHIPAIDPTKNEPNSFESQLGVSMRSFIVRRGKGKTIIAGYPWFLDWGRDTLICVRGMIGAGFHDEAREILHTFARFEENGTLPNTIHGDNVSNRDTSDAPLWFALCCEEFAKSRNSFYNSKIDGSGKSIKRVLAEIAEGYLGGTPNGIQVDAASALVWSPSHFTWMDTNYPAGTPREGYPVEIQALWIRLLRQLAGLHLPRKGASYSDLATLAETSFHSQFWLEHCGWFSDVLLAKKGIPSSAAIPDQALRSNCLFAVSLGLASSRQSRRCVEAARRHLIVPGALRSLAPLPTTPPLPIHAADGRLLNNPSEPYWGRYEGDEDTRRKPAYHNGTAWTWTFPVFCEALAQAYENSPEAISAARAYLGSMADLISSGCLGHLPEIIDGDAPHQQRGCDAQAWGTTEALRVWIKLTQNPEQ